MVGLGSALLLAAGAARADCAGEIMALQERIDDMPAMASTEGIDPDGKPTARIVEANRADTRADAASGPAPLPAQEGPVPDPGTTLGAAPSAAAGGGSEQAHKVPSGSGEAAVTPGPIEEPDAAGGVLVQRDTEVDQSVNQPAVPPPTPVEPMDEDEIQAKEASPMLETEPADLDTTEAAQALARAQAYYQAGDEAACLDAIDEAKSHLDQP
jgi:hypothetical protein